jgi:hypothetical protein
MSGSGWKSPAVREPRSSGLRLNKAFGFDALVEFGTYLEGETALNESIILFG